MSGKDKAHKHKQFCPVTAWMRGRFPDRVARGQMFIRADFSEGGATRHCSLKKRVFQSKGGRQLSESAVW